MKILYCGVSSKYIHTLPAGWFLAEYLHSRGIAVSEMYRNVNEDYQSVLQQVLDYNADVLLFSVYIFNVNFVKRLAEEIKELRPSCAIIAGGPEVDADFPADHIIFGEGEKALHKLLTEGEPRLVCAENFSSLDEIPSPYTAQRLQSSRNKLIYYESSRGCPFRCAYCTAGQTVGVRYFSLERVKKDLIEIVKSGAKIIKFTDRTFNADYRRADDIIRFIAETFGGHKVCFHFEVGGDLFKQSTLELLKKLPDGLVQIEAGVQSLNSSSLAAVNRSFEKEIFIKNISEILSRGNVHTHLDLIAGLPHETMDSFALAINEVSALRPHMLQLGFLKFLKGTPIRHGYNAKYSPQAPYEVISTPDMSEDDFKKLKAVAAVVDKIYNSGRFYYTLEYLFGSFGNPYAVFCAIADFFSTLKEESVNSLTGLYGAVLDFLGGSEKARELLRFDFLVSNNSRKIPRILQRGHSSCFKKFLAGGKASKDFLFGEFLRDGRLLIIRFDYTKKHPVTGRYAFEVIS
ncbi:MAG: DUF4080 domain-containing protein [Clostridia bacterium]|nr:DUF4080 domain-containing protein [Clostridia bacterium]